MKLFKKIKFDNDRGITKMDVVILAGAIVVAAIHIWKGLQSHGFNMF